MKHKADVNKKDKENKIPLQYAKTVSVLCNKCLLQLIYHIMWNNVTFSDYFS